MRLVPHPAAAVHVVASVLSSTSANCGGDDDDDDNNNDTGYESWTEGSWCWLLPNNAPTPVTIKNKITQTMCFRRHVQ